MVAHNVSMRELEYWTFRYGRKGGKLLWQRIVIVLEIFFSLLIHR